MTMSSFRATLTTCKKNLWISLQIETLYDTIQNRQTGPHPDTGHMVKHTWNNTAYKNPKEDIPKDSPIPLGKRIVLMHYFDANLMRDVLSGNAVTGIVHFYNNTPTNWYSKKQSTTETASYGAEFVSC